MIGGDSRLEQRLDALISQHGTPRSRRAWLSICGLLVLLVFRYRLAVATRVLLALAAAVAFARGQPIGGGIVVVLFLTYLFQIPLIVGILLAERDSRRTRRD